MNITSKKIRVLIIDDSALVRDILTKGLSSDPGIEVLGAAPDVFVGRDMIVKLRPDVITLDIEMPRMDGIEFLRRLMPQFPIPVVVVSSLTQKGKHITLQALESGAVDYVPKPATDIARGLQDMMMELRTKINIASTANVSHWKNKRLEAPAKKSATPGAKALAESTDKVIALGASTGGTEAIRKVLEDLPPSTPGMVIVQHMPSGFTKTFADRLNELSMMQVKEAESGDRILQGRVLIAPGDFHLKVIRSGGQYRVECFQSEKVNGHRPSVDVMMFSVAEQVGSNAFGVILTGMGKDGAQGLKAMKDAGSSTIGQDEGSCVVYGMPKAAFELGAVDYQLPLDNVSNGIMNLVNHSRGKSN
ncbi:MAG: two-component system, chemotaxis family, protein-glutamate methylesterase/glutaminase [Bacteroidota bacterium]|nr:two-component system, chemotaxis family, protein-glutamate methylesterase/glutaminase [Bacteroidota bacterium]